MNNNNNNKIGSYQTQSSINDDMQLNVNQQQSISIASTTQPLVQIIYSKTSISQDLTILTRRTPNYLTEYQRRQQIQQWKSYQQRFQRRQQWQQERQRRLKEQEHTYPKEINWSQSVIEELTDPELAEKLAQLEVYDQEQTNAKEQWEQEQLKLFEENEQFEQQELKKNFELKF